MPRTTSPKPRAQKGRPKTRQGAGQPGSPNPQPFGLDEKEWVCTPQGPLTPLIVEIPEGPSFPSALRYDWALYNAGGRAITEAIKGRKPVSLRQLRRIFGQFTARHQRTGAVVSSDALRNNLRYVPG